VAFLNTVTPGTNRITAMMMKAQNRNTL